MTRFIYDQFSKDYLEELLSPLGQVQSDQRVAGEVRQIDVCFIPQLGSQTQREALGLLGRFASTPAFFEPFRNPASADEIGDCVIKLLLTQSQIQREAKRTRTKTLESTIPKLWILTPTVSKAVLSKFGGTTDPDWVTGVYFMDSYFRSAIVAIHQLPPTPDTMWLRILGRGKVQKRAIDELESLPIDNLERKAALECLYSLQKHLEVTQNQENEDRELVMRLAPLYQQDREQAIQFGEQRGIQIGEQRGIEFGERLVVENLLQYRFNSLDEELSAIIEPILALPPSEFTPMLMQLSREELLARFGQ